MIDLVGKTSIADSMIVASGRSARQVGAMADHLLEKLKQADIGPIRIEGKANADWVLIDAIDVIVHLFRPEVTRLLPDREDVGARHARSGPCGRVPRPAAKAPSAAAAGATRGSGRRPPVLGRAGATVTNPRRAGAGPKGMRRDAAYGDRGRSVRQGPVQALWQEYADRSVWPLSLVEVEGGRPAAWPARG